MTLNVVMKRAGTVDKNPLWEIRIAGKHSIPLTCAGVKPIGQDVIDAIRLAGEDDEELRKMTDTAILDSIAFKG